jgi:predicted enzyme related to lactoylglutathione lyase
MRPMVRILGYSWAGIHTENFEAAIRFFTEKLGLLLTYRAEDTDFALFRLPSGQLFEVFGPNSEDYAATREEYAGVHPASCPIVGFEVEDVEAAREQLVERGVEFIHEVRWSEEGDSSWATFRGPDGQLLQVWRPEERYRMGQQ